MDKRLPLVQNRSGRLIHTNFHTWVQAGQM